MNKNIKMIRVHLKSEAYRDFMKRRIKNIAAETERVQAELVAVGWKNNKTTLDAAKRLAVECEPLSIDSAIWFSGWDAAFETFEKDLGLENMSKIEGRNDGRS